MNCGETRQLDEVGEAIDRTHHAHSHAVPSPMHSMDHPVRQVACGSHHTLALTTGGQLWMWGNGYPTPIRVPGLSKKVIQIACGRDHFCAITDEPTMNLWCWGNNTRGQCGTGNTKNVGKPTRSAGELRHEKTVHVSAGNQVRRERKKRESREREREREKTVHVSAGNQVRR